jgi:hypothetical protein
MFSSVLGEPKPDWPVQTRMARFASFDGFTNNAALPLQLLRFLENGPSPIALR